MKITYTDGVLTLRNSSTPLKFSIYPLFLVTLIAIVIMGIVLFASAGAFVFKAVGILFVLVFGGLMVFLLRKDIVHNCIIDTHNKTISIIIQKVLWFFNTRTIRANLKDLAEVTAEKLNPFEGYSYDRDLIRVYLLPNAPLIIGVIHSSDLQYLKDSLKSCGISFRILHGIRQYIVNQG